MNKLKYISSLILTVVLLFSCEESLEDLNIDPNNPGQATPELVFPAGVTSSASVIGGRYAVLGGIWSQYYTQNNASNQYKEIDAFYLTPSDFATQWQELYAGSLNDLKNVKAASAKAQNWSFYLMSTVIEAYTFQVLADLYGDIPFSEALLGDAGNITPHYDAAAAIYDSLIARIDVALAKDFTTATVKDPGQADLIFGAAASPLATDMDNWTRFANTLKLKIYLRQTNSRPTVASAGIQALYAAGAKFLVADAALNRFEDIASKSNPLFEQDQRQLNTKENLKASKTLFNFLSENADPRLDELYIPGNAGQKAMDQGNFNAPSTQLDPLSISRGRFLATDAVYFISKAESFFLQAEAVALGYGTGDAQALYNAGVEAAFERFGLEADAAAFTDAGGAYEYGKFYDNTNLGTIYIQKWASMAGTRQGIESFFERMRTGYPKVSPVYHTDAAYQSGFVVYPKEGTTSGKFATRLFYPNTEVSRNPNTPAQPELWDPIWYHK